MTQSIDVLYQDYERELRGVFIDNFEARGRFVSRGKLLGLLKQLKGHPGFDPEKLRQVVAKAHEEAMRQLEAQGKL
jgi:hypothetical protein